MKNHLSSVLLLLLMLWAIGCDEEPDDRITRLTMQMSEDQSRQNREVAELTKDIAADQRRMVEVVEKSRHDLISLEGDLQEQRNRLDQERQALANWQFRESLLVPVLQTVGMSLVVALPLVLCWYLLHGMRGASNDEEMSEILLNQDWLRLEDQNRPPTTPDNGQDIDRRLSHYWSEEHNSREENI